MVGAGSTSASGYWLGGELIITSNVGCKPENDDQFNLKAQFIGSQDYLTCEAVWESNSDGHRVSLVRISEEAWTPPSDTPALKLGQVVGDLEIDSTVVGFVQEIGSPGLDSEVILGKINPRLRKQAGMVVMIPDDPEPIMRNGVLWQSLEGAALVCGNVFVGVLTLWYVVGQCRMIAVPVSRLLSDRIFASLLHAALDAKPTVQQLQGHSPAKLDERTEESVNSAVESGEGSSMEGAIPPLASPLGRSEQSGAGVEVEAGQKRKAGKSQSERIFYKASTWSIFGIAAGLLPLLRGSGLAFDEAVEAGELYYAGAVISLAALGDMFYSIMPLSVGRKLVLRKRDVFSPLLYWSIAVSLFFILLNVICVLKMPPVNDAKLGVHGSFFGYYAIFVASVMASLLLAVLGASVDE
jgi:hypothetical protein